MHLCIYNALELVSSMFLFLEIEELNTEQTIG